jgi:hypothetical protein
MNAPAAPDDLIGSLRRRLAAQALWRSGLFFIPPLLAAWYIVFFLYRFAWLGPDAVMATGAAFLVAAAAFTAARFYRRAPSRLGAARLVDEKADGKERFVTLATIGDSGSAEFISRVRAEAAALARRIDFKRDFPFRCDRSILNSLIAALAAVIVFQLAFEWLTAWTPAAPDAKLGAAAKMLAQEPRFAELAADISAAAQKLRRSSLSAEEKQAIVRDIQNKIEERIAAEKKRDGDVASLEAVAQQFRVETRQETARFPWLTQGDDAGGKGAGGRGEGSGAGQNLDGKDGLGKGKDQRKGKVLDPSRQTKEEPRSAVQGEKPSERPDYLIKDGSQARSGGKAAEEKRDGEGGETKYFSGAKGEPRDNTEGSGISGDKTPARLGTPGEKISGGLNEKDLRYVIVQLPEEEGGGAGGSREAQRGKSRQPAPSANVPLVPPDNPKAAGEKQMLPLEYRGLIR